MFPDVKIRDLKRQIEIAALVYEKQGCYSELDLAELLTVSEPRIHRDVADLRALGVGIYSRKKRFHIDGSEKIISRLIKLLIVLSDAENGSRLVPDCCVKKSKTLKHIAGLNRAINESKVVQIEYRSDWREVLPAGLYEYSGRYYLLAVYHKNLMSFSLDSIQDIRYPDRKFSPDAVYGIPETVKLLWGQHAEGTEHDVKLLFDRSALPLVRNRVFAEGQSCRETRNGYEVRFTAKLTYEFIAWILGWGKTVTVLEPAELKDTIIRTSREIIETYETAPETNAYAGSARGTRHHAPSFN